MENNRYIKLEKACNFREIGDLDIPGGHKMKRGILFRSDELSQLTAKDRKKFENLNIKLVIDLRGIKERQKKIDRIPDHLKIPVINIPIDHRNQDLKQIEFFLFLIKKSKDFDFEKYIKEHYFGTAFECTAQLKEIFTLLSDANNLPALIHCTVGKDRTGVLSALLQQFAGVPRNIVLKEYMETNKYIDGRVNRIIRMIRIMSFFRASIEQIRPMLEVRPDYINNVLDEVEKRYGTVENYLHSACGIDNATQQKLKNLILE